MKMKTWSKPHARVEEFVANTCVSACNPTAAGYRFECNAKEGPLYIYSQSDGKIDGVYTGNGKPDHIGKVHPCGAKHDVKKNDAFFDGFIDYNGNKHQDPGEGVIVWQERKHHWLFGDYNDYHATTKLDITQWEKAAS